MPAIILIFAIIVGIAIYAGVREATSCMSASFAALGAGTRTDATVTGPLGARSAARPSLASRARGSRG